MHKPKHVLWERISDKKMKLLAAYASTGMLVFHKFSHKPGDAHDYISSARLIKLA
ncbi:MAG: hypothetical protein ACPLYE_01810 [Candidatus Micrarchaeales archaeon]